MKKISKIAATSLIVAAMFSGIMSPVSADTDEVQNSNSDIEYLEEAPVIEYKTCTSLKSATKLAGFTFCIPDAPKEYPNIDYKVRVDTKKLYANYSNSEGNIIYTIIIQPADSFEDISGADTHEAVLNLSMGNVYYTMYGPEKGKISKVTWRNNGFNFAFVAANGKVFSDSNIKKILKVTSAIEGVKSDSTQKLSKCKSQTQAAKLAGYDFDVPSPGSEYPVVSYVVDKNSKRVNIKYENDSGSSSYTISIQPGDEETDLSDEYKIYYYSQDIIRGKVKYHKYGSGQSSVYKATWYKDGYNYLIIRTDDKVFSSNAISNLTKRITVKDLEAGGKKKPTIGSSNITTKKDNPDASTVEPAIPSGDKVPATEPENTVPTPPEKTVSETSGIKTYENLDDALESYGAYVFLPVSGGYTATNYGVGKNGTFVANYKITDGSGTFKIEITKGEWDGESATLPYKAQTSIQIDDGMSSTGHRTYYFAGDTEGEWKMIKWSINGYTYSIIISGITLNTQEISSIADFILVE